MIVVVVVVVVVAMLLGWENCCWVASVIDASVSETLNNKCSAVVRWATVSTIDIRQIEQGCCAAFAGGGELGPHLTQCGLGRGLLLYQVASSSIQPFGHNRHGPKTGGYAPFRGGSCDPI